MTFEEFTFRDQTRYGIGVQESHSYIIEVFYEGGTILTFRVHEHAHKIHCLRLEGRRPISAIIHSETKKPEMEQCLEFALNPRFMNNKSITYRK